MTGPAGTNEGMATADSASVDGAPADTGLRADAEQALRALAGPAARLREDQWTAISALVAGRRALVVQRTGWGKSAVYFLATGTVGLELLGAQSYYQQIFYGAALVAAITIPKATRDKFFKRRRAA